MSIMELGVIYNQKRVDLPVWVRFAFRIGSFMNQHGAKYKKRMKILISLPSNQYFALFVAMGIVDKNFAVNKQFRSIRNTILNLKKGSRIVYHDNLYKRKVSVIGLEPSPVFEGQMILKVQDKNFVRGIPEGEWINKISIIDEEDEEIKQSRKVNEKQQIGIAKKPLLQKLYTYNQLQKAAFYPGDYFYLVGDKERFAEEINDSIFGYADTIGSIGDFLYIDNNNSYTNGELFSSKKRKFDFKVDETVPVIFSDSTGYIKLSHYFYMNPQVIIVSREDSETRSEEVLFEIKREMLESDNEIMTSELLEYLGEENIPNHIEFIAWRE